VTAAIPSSTATNDPGTTGANWRKPKITASDSTPTSGVSACVSPRWVTMVQDCWKKSPAARLDPQQLRNLADDDRQRQPDGEPLQHRLGDAARQKPQPQHSGEQRGELGLWRRRAGLDADLPANTAEPYAFQLAGDWERAAALWREIGYPYETALALADADDDALHRAVEQLQALGARTAAAIIARRLRERGARSIPRGPRARTRENPAGLTARQL
jgi:hypothetical protein